MAANRFVIYRVAHSWVGAGEYIVGRWPFRRAKHAPVFHADTPHEVFSWLVANFPGRVIVLDPEVGRRYSEEDQR